MSELRFDNQVVVITGAGYGIGKAYALYYADRGAKVVVNDLDCNLRGDGHSTKVSDMGSSSSEKRGPLTNAI